MSQPSLQQWRWETHSAVRYTFTFKESIIIAAALEEAALSVECDINSYHVPNKALRTQQDEQEEKQRYSRMRAYRKLLKQICPNRKASSK